MRSLKTLAVAFAVSLGAAGAALADPVAAPPAAISAELQEQMTEDYGDREIAVLQRAVQSALQRELATLNATLVADEAAPIRIEVTIVDAKPNRPTLQQLSDRPGLSYGLSRSLGGATLRAVLVRADGTRIAEVEHDYYERDIGDVVAAGTWTDARRAIRGFSHKVAEAYAAAHSAS